MAATLSEFDSWIAQAKITGHQYVISVCDTFDYSDYPVYCKDAVELAKRRKEFNNVNMQRINEIVDVSKVKTKKK